MAALRSEYLTVLEVAQRLRVSKMTVYRLIEQGELPAIRIGRAFRVEVLGLARYLERSRIGD